MRHYSALKKDNISIRHITMLLSDEKTISRIYNTTVQTSKNEMIPLTIRKKIGIELFKIGHSNSQQP